MSEDAILNANYLRANLMGTYYLPYNRICMHEVVLSGKNIKNETGITTLDIAKRLIDNGLHPPTVYFPLIVDEALMIEPTETESKESLDAYIAAMKEIAQEAREDPDILHSAPHFAPVTRLDEVGAARQPNLRWKRPAPPAPAVEVEVQQEQAKIGKKKGGLEIPALLSDRQVIGCPVLRASRFPRLIDAGQSRP